MTRPRRSITRRLMTLVLLTSVTALVLTAGALLTYETVTFRRSMVQELSTLGRVIAANSTAALAFGNETDAEDVLSALQAESHIRAAGLYDERGMLFARYPADLEDEALPSSPEPPGFRFGSDELVLSEVVERGNRQLGVLYLRSDLGAMHERLRLYGSVVLIVTLVSSSIAVVLSMRVQRQISRPILALSQTAQRVRDDRDYSVRAAPGGDGELGELTDAFNTMLARVQEQDRSLRDQGDRLRHEVAERARVEDEVRALNIDLERRVAERTEALAAANKELESFSYSVSHDLRAPLRHVLGYVEMLRDDFGAQLSDDARRYMDVIQKASTDMGQLIDDLLAFSRTSRAELSEEVVPLEPLIRSVIQGLELTTQDRLIEWRISALPTVLGDPALLKQVFANLIDNAVKYSRMRQPAVIVVGVGDAPPGSAVLFVRDNGAGFDMRYAQKLFGVFQRLHRSEEFEGTGIGLATVQRIVHRHGGRIWAESAVGEGATFYVSLPTPQPAADATDRTGVS